MVPSLPKLTSLYVSGRQCNRGSGAKGRAQRGPLSLTQTPSFAAPHFSPSATRRTIEGNDKLTELVLSSLPELTALCVWGRQVQPRSERKRAAIIAHTAPSPLLSNSANLTPFCVFVLQQDSEVEQRAVIFARDRPS